MSLQPYSALSARGSTVILIRSLYPITKFRRSAVPVQR